MKKAPSDMTLKQRHRTAEMATNDTKMGTNCDSDNEKHNSNTAISRKVVRKTMHATIPKGNMGYDQCNFPDTVDVESTFVAFF